MTKLPSIIRALIDQQVRFVVVGGFAVQLHGFVRATIDFDCVLAMDDGNLSRFIEVAKSFGLEPVVPVKIDVLKNAKQIEQWHQEKGMLAFALREPSIGGSVVDVLVRPEVPFEKLEADAAVVSLFDREVKIASIDALLTMKRIANRLKDRLDIDALEKIKRGEDPYA